MTDVYDSIQLRFARNGHTYIPTMHSLDISPFENNDRENISSMFVRVFIISYELLKITLTHFSLLTLEFDSFFQTIGKCVVVQGAVSIYRS